MLDRLKFYAFIYCIFLSNRQICAPYALPFEFESNSNIYQKQTLQMFLISANSHPHIYKMNTVYANSLDNFIESRAPYFKQGILVGEKELLSRINKLPSPHKKKYSVTKDIVKAIENQKHVRYNDINYINSQQNMLSIFKDWNGEPLTAAFFTKKNLENKRHVNIISQFLQDVYVKSHIDDFRFINNNVECVYNFPFLNPKIPVGEKIDPQLSDVYYPALEVVAILAFGKQHIDAMPAKNWYECVESRNFFRLREIASTLLKKAAEVSFLSNIYDITYIIGSLSAQLEIPLSPKSGEGLLDQACTRCIKALNMLDSIPRQRSDWTMLQNEDKIFRKNKKIALFLFALDLEESSFRKYCKTINPFVKDLFPISVSKVEFIKQNDTSIGFADIYTCSVGKGNEQAAVVANRIIDRLKPDIVIFTGIAGGIKDVEVGDVVVATSVHNYQAGKEIDNTFKSRPTGGRLPYSIEGLIKYAQRMKFDILAPFEGERPNPRIHFGQIVSGSKVVAERAQTYEQIRTSYNDPLALAMEEAGIFEAVHVSGVTAAIIRGISDTLTGKNVSDEFERQLLAADLAARVSIATYQSWILNHEYI